VGADGRAASSPGFFLVLEETGGDLADFYAAGEKILEFCKKTVCICEKMGYNKEYLLLGKSAKAQR